MAPGNLADWLAWQETLNPAEIDLGLERMHHLVDVLQIAPPPGAVFTVAGTNGKGSCAAAIEYLLRRGGLCTALYTSPHLVRYNERICIDGRPATDTEIVQAFERIETVRGDTPLTFFEYGTLAALLIFSARECDAWVLEVGLGGRLDAVNAIDPDFAVITTIGLDHQAWLGDSIAEIAAEKAGIMRAGRPCIYGDVVVPYSVLAKADETGARLLANGKDFDCILVNEDWSWRGQSVDLMQLELPPGAGREQLRNLGAALAAVEQYDPQLLEDEAALTGLATKSALPGRFQIFGDTHRWILDVAHNPQAAHALARRLRVTGNEPVTVIVALQADKDVPGFAHELEPVAQRWITCSTEGYRGCSSTELAKLLADAVDAPVTSAANVGEAIESARGQTEPGGRILVCGSFMLVGPVLELLGLY
ncbi:MAG: folylpolyglutamate synthase/dihydrofolate synthase family protein [Gammaproteobacteria bacterium]|jgi:dihydrofolate synthase/folylpolyglutamate synthase|nr:folylpolyglutamate synthase/dihydrofolate synthase family protein [Gammaproteobacteria bacterium]MDP6616329.1 folylpolyglutamate synthase/dihydrofolate synthase family protein [Gammaproteobacteria bacterium]MDP6695915.1 folylpolyglutamate synthase/dihydrofolate synthase family protein [Gammaproteobacteria bacterium]